MKTKLSLSIITALVAVSLLGQGTMIVDQHNDPYPPGGFFNLVPQPSGQSFVPTFSSVGFIQLFFSDSTYPSSGATMFLNLWSGSLTNGTLLGTTDPLALPVLFNGATNFVFSSPVTVTPGTTYYFQPVIQSGDNEQPGVTTVNAYTNGMAYFNGAPAPNIDFWFREGTPVPEPSSVAFTLLGGVAWLLLRRRRSKILLFGLGLVLVCYGVHAQNSVPKYGTFYLQSSIQNGRVPPPYPFDPYGGLEPIAVVDAANHIYLVQDNSNDWATLQAIQSAGRMSTMDAPQPPGSGGGNGELPNYPSWTPPTNGLWLEITNVDMTSQLAYLLLHNTTNTEYYQWLRKTNLLQSEWMPGEYKFGDPGINQTIFAPVNLGDNPTLFFWAHQADAVVSIYAANPTAVEPRGTDSGQNGSFYLYGSWAGGATNDVTVYYRISGTASNGVDYVTLSGVATLTNSSGYSEIDVQPLDDGLLDGMETVTLTLIPTNGYVIDPNAASATVNIYDFSTIIGIYPDSNHAVEPDGPPGAPATDVSFGLLRNDLRGNNTNDLTVCYSISGTASNGVDYVLLSGTAEFAPGVSYTNIVIAPLAVNLADGTKTVTLTLIPTNGYVPDPANPAATNFIDDSSTTVGIYEVEDAIEPGQDTNSFPAQNGVFYVSRSDTRGATTNGLTLFYSVSGTASNGVDYVALSGTVDFAPEVRQTNIDVVPLGDNLLEPNGTVVLTLTPDPSHPSGYLIDPHNASATINYVETVPTNLFVRVATLNGPVGIDYDSLSNSLIVSDNYPDLSGTAFNFARIYTNLTVSNSIIVTNVVIANWSAVSGLADEVELAAVQTNAGGFTNGDLYFGSNTGIGWLSANGSVAKLNWCVLTNATETNNLLLRGGLCVDQTGIFSNDLIAVTSGGPNDYTGSLKGIWRVDSQAHPTLLANLDAKLLEGVITLPNDTNHYGPWAGKIITGDEGSTMIYTIDTNGAVAAYDTASWTPNGIHSEHFNIIPPHQSLYACDTMDGWIVKVSADYLTNYVGDLLITDGGETVPGAKLCIVRWDAPSANFVVIAIPYVGAFGDSSLEDATFAPIELPSP